MMKPEQYPIPTLRNLLIFAVALPVDIALLWFGSHASLPFALLAAVGFSLVNNTMFTLMHEAIHGVLLPWRTPNALLGQLAGAMFPVPFVAYSYGHMQHHVRNRTDDELFDYYLPSERRWKCNLWLYLGNLGGFYWFLIPFATVLYLLAPWLLRSPKWAYYAKDYGIGAGVGDVAKLPVLQGWLQCLFVVLWQVALIYLLDLSLTGWLLCYWAFAVHWSALQYVHHAWSIRDVERGAWNLSVWPPLRWLALNYHSHLAHHTHPDVPWIYLQDFIGADEKRPGFFRNYLTLWGGVRPAPPFGTQRHNAPAKTPAPARSQCR